MRKIVLCSLLAIMFSCSIKRQTILIYESGASFNTLVDAVDNCKEGDSIIVYPGKYVTNEDVFLNKDYVTITGVGKPQILCTNMEENVIWVQADHVVIKGIKASHVKPEFYANCVGNVFGLDNAHDVRIENCEINGCGRIGVYIFDATGVVLKKNWIHNNSLSAVQIDGLDIFAPTDEFPQTITFIKNKINDNGSDTKNQLK